MTNDERLLRCGGILVSCEVTGSVQSRRSNDITGLAGFLVLVVLSALPDGKRATFYGITRLYHKDPKLFHEDLPERANSTEYTILDLSATRLINVSFLGISPSVEMT